jgi:hypothetical protein
MFNAMKKDRRPFIHEVCDPVVLFFIIDSFLVVGQGVLAVWSGA